jgi:hypothetical protein
VSSDSTAKVSRNSLAAFLGDDPSITLGWVQPTDKSSLMLIS